MGAQSEIQPDTPQSVAWINRDPVANVPPTGANEPQPNSPSSPLPARRKWLLIAVILAIVVAAFLLVRHLKATRPGAGQANANSIPVVTVTTTGSRAVTARIR